MYKYALVGVTALAAGTVGVSAQTLDEVMSRGELNCGVSTGLAGFSAPDADGEWQGFDVDFCRAVAAAVLGDAHAVNFTPLSPERRFDPLGSGEIDILSRNTTWTFTRDMDLGYRFVGTNYYDGQGFIVPTDLGVESALELDGATVCIQTGTTTELNLSDFFSSNDMSYEPNPVETNAEAQEQYLAGSCDTYTTDRSGLAATRASFENPDDHMVLPETISKEPLGPVVRKGDEDWAGIVQWTLFALITAEELGVTSENVEQIAEEGSDEPEIERLVGLSGDFGELIGLENDWAVKAIAAVGNYAEIFDRNIGEDTPIGIERGLNAQYDEGGILYSPPFR